MNHASGWMGLAGGAALVGLLAAGGCGRGMKRELPPASREVALAEFAGAPPEASEPGAPTSALDPAAEEQPGPGGEAETVGGPAGPETPAAETPWPLGAASEPAPPGTTRWMIVERMVGEVNGRPIFADEFFEPIADELRAEGERLGRQDFYERARTIVGNRLRDVVLSELFLAEAESGLSPEEQQGLFGWIQQLRETVVNQLGGGSRSATERRLEESEGTTVEQYVRARRDQALIGQLLREKVTPRVIVSWRDVQREYERRYEQFNPPATVMLARISLSTSRQGERIEEVKRRLVEGESFASIAESLEIANGGRWRQFEMGPGGLTDIDLDPSVSGNLEGLAAGETTEALEVGSFTWWLHVAEIDRPEGRSLYDPEVQQALHSEIWNRRFAEERSRYIARLLEEGIYDELSEMNERLLEVALLRYGP